MYISPEDLSPQTVFCKWIRPYRYVTSLQIDVLVLIIAAETFTSLQDLWGSIYVPLQISLAAPDVSQLVFLSVHMLFIRLYSGAACLKP